LESVKPAEWNKEPSVLSDKDVHESCGILTSLEDMLSTGFIMYFLLLSKPEIVIPFACSKEIQFSLKNVIDVFKIFDTKLLNFSLNIKYGIISGRYD
jgi:hypothetical protein